MGLLDLLDRIAQDPDCVVAPAAGQPKIDPSYVVPEDVRAFYEVCGGLIIGRGSSYEVRIVGPAECVLANDIILGEFATTAREQQGDDQSWNWYITAEVENGNYLAIDFGRTHTGRCYDAFWETYGMPGQMPVIATSLTSLVDQLYEHKGQYWYWLEPQFQALGDAYDT